MSDTRLFDLIDRLVAALPLDPQRAGEILGVALARDPAADTAAVQVWTAGAGTDVTGVELRMPDALIGTGHMQLALTLPEGGTIGRQAVIARYGTSFRSDVPSPRYPLGTVPVYLVYTQPWGRLAFGFHTVSGLLVGVTISGPAAPAPRN